ncbi:MAG: site-2 protease family protein [Planctomycetota bacterium]
MSAIFNDPKLAVLALILGFGFLIFVHELGHFAVAKWCGIRATQFAIGFGHALLSYRKGLGLRVGGTEKEYFTRALEALERDGKSIEGLSEHQRNQLIMEKADALGLSETEYRLNWIPLGGYVKMLGQEDLDPAAQSDDPRAYNKKSIGARMAVISAGVIMNLIFALIFFIICFQMGVKFPAPVVGDVSGLSPAATTFAEGHADDPAYMGLRIGDRVVSANGKPVEDLSGIKIATALGKAGQAVELVVEREGEPKTLTYNVTPRPDHQQEMLLTAGIAPSPTLRIIAVYEDTPFAEAGVKAGSTITAVNGLPVETYGQYAAAIDQTGGQPVAVTVTGEDQTAVTVEIEPVPAFRTSIDEIALAGLTPATRISAVTEDSPAARAGAEPQDLIARLGGVDWPSTEDVMRLIREAGGKGVELTVQRGGKPVDLGRVKPNTGPFAKNRGRIGIALGPALDEPIVGRVLPDSPLADANLPGGSQLVSINGQPVTDWVDLQRALAAIELGDDGPATAVIQAKLNLGEQPEEAITAAFDAAQLALVRHAGWAPPRNIGLDDLLIDIKADGPVEATAIGAVKTKEFIQQTYITLLRLFQGSIRVNNLRGPVGIVDQGAKVARQGLPYFLFFLGLISVNLAVLNFLPLPIVDGGHMVFLIIEKLKGSPASPKVQVAVSLVGLVGLACIFLYVTFNDISRLVTG